MCGIAGLIHTDMASQDLPDIIVGMLDRISHRGPDGMGTVIGDDWALGTARLTPPPVLIDQQGRARFLDIAGPPLGAFTDPDYDEWCVPFPPGTSLLVYSDALTESESGGKLVCDDATLLRWATETAPDACMVGTILNRFRAHIPGEPPDDLTLLHIRRPADDQENVAAS